MKTDTDGSPTLVTPKPLSSLSEPGLTTPTSPRKKGLGIGTKFFLAATLLVVATLGVAIAFATWRANQVAEKAIREGLAKVPAAFQSEKNSFETQLKATVRSIADEPGTKVLLAPDVSNETVYEWTQTKTKLLGAKSVFLFDRAGRILARSDRNLGEDVGRPFNTVKWVLSPIETWLDATAVIREGKILSTVASSPVISGEKAANEARLEGVVAASVPFDTARVRALRGITGGQAGFLANTAKRGDPPSAEVTASTEGFFGDSLVRALPPGTLDTLFTKGEEVGPIDVLVNGDRRLVKAIPIKSANQEALGAFVVSRSRDEEMAAFKEIRNALLLIGLVSILVAIPVSLAMGRRIAKPLEELARGAVAIREGRLDVKLPEAGGDEVGALARAFSAMVGELREKAQLESMLADMQRRTVEAPVVKTEKLTGPISTPGEGPQVGQSFGGRYQILGTLGKGGMGAVYRALDKELDDDVALKVLMPDAFEEGTIAVQTLKQEIRLARRITHPNVVRTHDMGEVAGVRFLTMEYVPGTTLREVIDRKGAVALAPGVQIAKQLCRGLAAVHEAGIVHRDIKPHNIMVLPNGVVKLMDFGIAKQTEGVDPNAETGQTVGTPYYMSPEQARGENLDSRSDLYSVGVVLYELFTGERPIEGRDPLEVMKRHVSMEPRRPKDLRTDLPDLLDRILMACLAKAKDKRPPTANDLYGALMRLAV